MKDFEQLSGDVNFDKSDAEKITAAEKQVQDKLQELLTEHKTTSIFVKYDANKNKPWAMVTFDNDEDAKNAREKLKQLFPNIYAEFSQARDSALVYEITY